jgi:hypothetical protein
LVTRRAEREEEGRKGGRREKEGEEKYLRA